jgi:hypothetical protein
MTVPDIFMYVWAASASSRITMTGQAGVRLFQIVIELGLGTVEGWRNLTNPEACWLSVTGQPDWFMTPQTAARLGRAARRLFRALSKTGVPNLRAADARDAEDEVKTGPMFTGRSQDGELMIELGIIDAGSIYLQLGDRHKLRLTGDQAAGLLQALTQFDDVSIPVGPVRHIRLAVSGAQMFESWDWWR